MDDLNRLGFAYRWRQSVSLPGQAEAEKDGSSLRAQWCAKRKKNIVALLRETIFQTRAAGIGRVQQARCAMRLAGELRGSAKWPFGSVTARDRSRRQSHSSRREAAGGGRVHSSGAGFVASPERPERYTG